MAGKPVHVEIPAKDSKRGMKFYSDLFGWEWTDWGPDAPMEYNMTRFSETSGGALYPSDEGGSGYRVYFDVDDINTAVARVQELGGKTEDVMPIPGVGYSASATDTEGNRFGLFQSDESVAPPQG
jgi:predicted enzyme related to lactoylglutathione lyase